MNLNKLLIIVNSAIACLCIPVIVNANTVSLNRDGFFLGVGAGFQPIKVDSKLSGQLSSLSGFPPTDTLNLISQSPEISQYSISEEVHVGYFKHLPCSEWLWGVKLAYQYLQNNSSDKTLYLDFDNAANTHNQVVADLETDIDHVFSGLVFFGRSYSHGFTYLGIGPVLFDANNTINNLYDDHSGYYIGRLEDLDSSSRWIWGGMVQVGINYYLNANWYFDLNYTYALSGRTDINNSGNFTPTINNGLNSGTLTINNSERINSQAIIVSINKVFSG